MRYGRFPTPNIPEEPFSSTSYSIFFIPIPSSTEASRSASSRVAPLTLTNFFSLSVCAAFCMYAWSCSIVTMLHDTPLHTGQTPPQSNDRFGVQLRDPRLGHAKHRTDLLQREVLVVIQDENLFLFIG